MLDESRASSPLKNILIVGGGTAGWLTAAVLAAGHNARLDSGVQVTLVESPDVATIGVGEGTWPSMRDTLSRIGVSERDFIRECGASFKQGSKFVGWRTGKNGEFYYHPFSLPQGYLNTNLVPYWQAEQPHTSFASAFSTQEALCQLGKAPKQPATPEYAAVANYAYHLDAGKFATFLQQHSTVKLGVKHVLDHVTAVNSTEQGDIESLTTKAHGNLQADLFIDCTGVASLLLGKHFAVPFISQKQVLFNDRAIAMQVPYSPDKDTISSATIATAQACGWIWDIGLPSRRGVGYVYSSDHESDDHAEQTLRHYVQSDPRSAPSAQITARRLKIQPGFRREFWHKNCVAVGMSAGFIEPLEASAIALVEMSAAMIRDELPANREVMATVARRFNERFSYRWQRVIEFLKLHYVLSQRKDSTYWLDHRAAESIPEHLAELIQLWRYHSPSRYDLMQTEEIFPSASYQYVLYGMGFRTHPRATSSPRESFEAANRHFQENKALMEKQINGLPSNRELINYLVTGLDKQQAPATVGRKIMTNHVLLNNIEHKDIRVIKDRSAEYGDNVMAVPLMPREFRDAQNDFPIFFHKDPGSDKLVPFAIFGLVQGENLYLEGANWSAKYLPLVLEKGPFLIGFQERSGGEKGLVISLDIDDPRVSRSEGEMLFLPHGGNSEYVERISYVLNAIHEGQGETEGFVTAMLEHDLIEPFALNVELNDGSRHRLEGFHTINEEKVTQLGADALVDLNKQGYLLYAHMVIASLSNIRKLIDKKNQQLLV